MALILVADDEFLLTMMLADILEDEGHEVDMASNGRQALDCARERRPDLIITDFMMPVMTGLELAEAVRADDGISDVPIILVSGAQGAMARERPELFQTVLDKPYENDILLAEVERLLSPDER